MVFKKEKDLYMTGKAFDVDPTQKMTDTILDRKKLSLLLLNKCYRKVVKKKVLSKECENF